MGSSFVHILCNLIFLYCKIQFYFEINYLNINQNLKCLKSEGECCLDFWNYQKLFFFITCSYRHGYLLCQQPAEKDT